MLPAQPLPRGGRIGQQGPLQEGALDPSDADLREALEASLRSAEEDRLFQEELSRAIRQSMEDAGSLTASGSQIPQAPETPSQAPETCIICLEQKICGIWCCCDEPSAAHFLCSGCLPLYVRSELQSDEESGRRLMERRAFGHCVRCPSGRSSDCQGFLQLEALRPRVPTELWSQLQATAEADENHRQWQLQHDREEDPEVLRESLLRSMPNAVQCAGCGYGPIDHMACQDLDAHHGEWQGSTQISNQCPRCGWWQHDIRQWPRWAGVLDMACNEERTAACSEQ